MTDKPAFRLTEPAQPTGFAHETEMEMCVREMEAHTAESLRLMRRQTQAEDARAAIHATLAHAWATRLGTTR